MLMLSAAAAASNDRTDFKPKCFGLSKYCGNFENDQQRSNFFLY